MELKEVSSIPKDLKPREVFWISSSGYYFSITWKRGGEMYGCKHVPSPVAMVLIMNCKDEIRRRKDPDARIEPWEAYDSEGHFSFKLYCSILDSRATLR